MFTESVDIHFNEACLLPMTVTDYFLGLYRYRERNIIGLKYRRCTWWLKYRRCTCRYRPNCRYPIQAVKSASASNKQEWNLSSKMWDLICNPKLGFWVVRQKLSTYPTLRFWWSAYHNDSTGINLSNAAYFGGVRTTTTQRVLFAAAIA